MAKTPCCPWGNGPYLEDMFLKFTWCFKLCAEVKHFSLFVNSSMSLHFFPFFFRTNSENETFTRVRRDPNGVKLPMSPSGKILLSMGTIGLISASLRFSLSYLKSNKHNSLHLTRKYARIFASGHYLSNFREALSFPRATFSENCSLLGTDQCPWIKIRAYSAPNGGYCLYMFKELFRPFVNKTGISLVQQSKQWINWYRESSVLSYAIVDFALMGSTYFSMPLTNCFEDDFRRYPKIV